MRGSRILNNPFSKIIEVQDRMFQIKRVLPESKINEVEDWVSLLKQYYHCDTMFRAKGHLWLCNKIIDIDYEEL